LKKSKNARFKRWGITKGNADSTRKKFPGQTYAVSNSSIKKIDASAGTLTQNPWILILIFTTW